MDTPLNCPCCESEAVYYPYFVGCTVCGLSISGNDHLGSAIERWNRRPVATQAGKIKKHNDYPSEFLCLYAEYPDNGTKKNAHKAWAARIKEGRNPDDLLMVMREYVKSLKRSGRTPLNLSTFFGPGEWIDKDWANMFKTGSDIKKVSHGAISAQNNAKSIKRAGEEELF